MTRLQHYLSLLYPLSKTIESPSSDQSCLKVPWRQILGTIFVLWLPFWGFLRFSRLCFSICWNLRSARRPDRPTDPLAPSDSFGCHRAQKRLCLFVSTSTPLKIKTHGRCFQVLVFYMAGLIFVKKQHSWVILSHHTPSNQWPALCWHDIFTLTWHTWNASGVGTKIVPSTRYFHLMEKFKNWAEPSKCSTSYFISRFFSPKAFKQSGWYRQRHLKRDF